MSKKLFLSTILLCLGLVAKAEPTDISQYENVVFPVSTTGIPGSTVTVSVEMNNTVNVTGFQFYIYLPEGITAAQNDEGDYLIELSGTRTTLAKHAISSALQEEDGSIKVLCSSQQSKTFDGNSGEVCTVALNIQEDVEEGDYPIIFKDIRISDSSAKVYRVEEVEATLTVESSTPPTYAEGYAVEVLPFAFAEDVDVNLLMDSESSIKAFEFDLVVPSVLITEELYVIGFNLSRFTTNAEVINGAIHVTGSSPRSTVDRQDFATLSLYYEGDLVSTGVYPITIKNIVLTDTSNETYMVAPYTTEIFVGEDPKIEVADGVAAFHGNYGGIEELELLKAALPEGATIDLTEVSAMAEDPSTWRTDNVIVTNDAISYGRSMTNDWGTLCLPFAVESNDNLQLYELKSVSSTAMTFDPVTSVEANTPVIFKKLSGDGFTVGIDNDGEFNMGFAAETPSLTLAAIEDWVLNGSYSEETIDVSGIQAYGLMNNEFHRFTKSLTAGAFRAWLQNNGTPMNATIRIEDSTEGISIVEQEDGSVKLIFDMQGRQLQDSSSRQIVIENGQKKFNK